MNERMTYILLGLVSEYIRTGRPVSSMALGRHLKLAVSPATIRHEMQELEEAGYIFQPHTSAGRIPTDKGYRFFVNHAQMQAMAIADIRRMRQFFQELYAANQQLTRVTAKFLAQLSRTVALSSQVAPRETEESGLREIVQHTEEESLAEIHEITRLLDALEDRLVSDQLPRQAVPQTYIGEENPVLPVKHTSMITRTVELPDGRELVLVIVGSKRMPYQRNIALLDTVATIIKDANL